MVGGRGMVTQEKLNSLYESWGGVKPEAHATTTFTTSFIITKTTIPTLMSHESRGCFAWWWQWWCFGKQVSQKVTELKLTDFSSE